ncbi:MAG: fliJ [Hydrocarboniphaga sp.]|uniref:flagellar export protein FliJ n=1 Tax=Hydrocarboniphaga sp. TaxID=2033016 RepID=UPI00260BB049|nr:flagellar export protein FliJ [Hydrocarboniphaga sp.]MDB5969841.1 fliJ [Hydrocarboniphaga sp.]
MLEEQRLVPIQELAEKREDDAARDLNEARKALTLRETQLRELENYREPPATAVSAEMLRNREAFRLRLSEAICQQRRAVELARRNVETQRQRWIGSHHQTQLYDKLIDRARTHEQTQQDRRDQRDLDEIALRMTQARSHS